MEKQTQRRYTPEERGKAVTLAQEVGANEAACQLGIPDDTLYGWILKAKKGTLAVETPKKEASASIDELERLRVEIKELKKQQKADKARMAQIEKEKKIQDDVIDFFVNRQKR